MALTAGHLTLVASKSCFWMLTKHHSPIFYCLGHWNLFLHSCWICSLFHAFRVLLQTSFPLSVGLTCLCLFTCFPFLVHQMPSLLFKTQCGLFPHIILFSALSCLMRRWWIQVAMVCLFVFSGNCLHYSGLSCGNNCSALTTTSVLQLLTLAGQQHLKLWWKQMLTRISMGPSLQEVLVGLSNWWPVLPLKQVL